MKRVYLVGGQNGGRFIETNETYFQLPKLVTRVTGYIGEELVPQGEQHEEYYVEKLRFGDQSRYIGVPLGRTVAWAYDRLIEAHK